MVLLRESCVAPENRVTTLFAVCSKLWSEPAAGMLSRPLREIDT